MVKFTNFANYLSRFDKEKQNSTFLKCIKKEIFVNLEILFRNTVAKLFCLCYNVAVISVKDNRWCCALVRMCLRKVRAPQGSVLDNVQRG